MQNTIGLKNKPLWKPDDSDPYNYFGKYVIADDRRTKMLIRTRVGQDNWWFKLIEV